MSKKAPPTIEEIETKCDSFFESADKDQDNQISLTEWKSYVSKNKEILSLLDAYGLMSKDDLRPDFGGADDDYPDCDSDLENEVILPFI
jgi:hypothetical protein